jgi:hypothetical protein
MYRQSGLDPAVISRSHAALANALQGDQHRTRAELAGVLAQAGILADGFRLSYLMMAAELDGILCSGPRRGKQFTYALLEERVPPAPPLTREEALAELTRRYFTSHGPATPRDFAWWSGLTMAEVKAGLEIARADLSSREVDGQVHWFVPTSAAADLPSPTAHLLPDYDEYGIGYKDHSAILEDPGYIHFFDPLQHAVYAHPFLMDGKVAGTWKRTVKKDSVEIEALSFKPPGEAEIQALSDAAGRYGQFMELPVTLSVQRVVRRE